MGNRRQDSRLADSPVLISAQSQPAQVYRVLLSRGMTGCGCDPSPGLFKVEGGS